MSLVLPDVGEVCALDMWLSDASPEAQTLKLFQSNTTPAEGDTHASYTEATFSGYAAKALARATWNAASTASGTTTKTYPQQTWTVAGATSNTIYGYYVVKATAGTLLWVETLFVSGQLLQDTDQLKLTLSIAMA